MEDVSHEVFALVVDVHAVGGEDVRVVDEQLVIVLGLVQTDVAFSVLREGVEVIVIVGVRLFANNDVCVVN